MQQLIKSIQYRTYKFMYRILPVVYLLFMYRIFFIDYHIPYVSLYTIYGIRYTIYDIRHFRNNLLLFGWISWTPTCWSTICSCYIDTIQFIISLSRDYTVTDQYLMIACTVDRPHIDKIIVVRWSSEFEVLVNNFINKLTNTKLSEM